MSQVSITIPKRRVSKVDSPGSKPQWQVFEELTDGTWAPCNKPRPHSTTAFSDLGRMVQRDTLKTYRLTVYQDNGEVQVQALNIEPSLEILQAKVGGYIEHVPAVYYENEDWFKKAHKGDLEDVWCDEEGGLKTDRQPNSFFPAINGRALYGNILVVEIVKS